MGKLKLAKRVADEFDTSIQKAGRFIDDVGPKKAEEALDTAKDAGRSFPWKKATAGLTVGSIGGGALYWREQDVRKAEAIADSSESYESAVSDIIDSDLPPDLKRDLINRSADVAEQDQDDDGDGEKGPIERLKQMIEDADPIMLLIGTAVVLVIVNNSMRGGQ